MKETLKQTLQRHGLKATSQRARIAKIFLSTKGHVGIDDLLRRIRRVEPRIGPATVYRTMRLLASLGLASERHFTDGRAVYEPAARRHHHDHMICERCGKVLEFENDQIERLQEEMARRHGFQMTRHRLELYGRCRSCSRRPAPDRAPRVRRSRAGDPATAEGRPRRGKRGPER